MDNFKEILKQFIEEQRNKSAASTNQQDSKSEIEQKLENLGFDADSIRDFLNNVPAGETTDQIIEDIFKLIGKEITFVKPTRVSDDGFISKSISTKETEQGLEREVVKPIIVAACGRIIKEEEIGVRCSTCNQYDCKEHAFVCHVCGKGICILHTFFFRNEKGENVPHCQPCYRTVIYNQYTW